MMKFGDNASMIKQQQEQLRLSMTDQLTALSDSINTEHTLSEQINDLREIRATLKEQLHGTDTELQKARLELIRLQEKDSDQVSKIANLEYASNNRQPVEDFQTIFRIQELDGLNKDLQKDITAKDMENSALRDENSTLRDESSSLRDDCNSLRDRLKVKEDGLQEFSMRQNKLVFEKEELRRRFLRAADQEMEGLKSKHLNEIQQLKLEMSRKAESRPKTGNNKGTQTSRSRPSLVLPPQNGYPHLANNPNMVGIQTESQAIEPDEDLFALFPATPKGSSHDVNVSQVTYSNVRVSSRDGKHEQRPSQVSGNAPRGILKTSAHESKGEKRTAAELGTHKAAGFTAQKKRRTNMTKDLGPVVKNSQSPVNAISGRARKQSVPRKNRRGEGEPQPLLTLLRECS